MKRNVKMKKLTSGTIVSSSNYGGVWKVLKVHKKIFSDCQRYDLKNKNGDILYNVRDKDIITEDNINFETFLKMII